MGANSYLTLQGVHGADVRGGHEVRGRRAAGEDPGRVDAGGGGHEGEWRACKAGNAFIQCQAPSMRRLSLHAALGSHNALAP